MDRGLAAIRSTMMSRRQLLQGLGLGAGALALASCSTGGGTPTPSGSGGGGTDKLTFWTISSFTENPDNELAASLAKFTESTGIEVDLQSFAPGDFKSKYLTAVLGGSGPDVASIDGAWTAELAAAQTIVDVSDSFGSVADRFLPGSAATANVQGAQFAVPWYANNVSLYCNKAMLAEAGVQAPTTWDELRSAAQAMTGGDKYGLMLGASWVGPFLWWSFLWQNGGEILNEDLTKSAFGDDAGVEAWEFYSGLALNDKVVPPQFTGVNAGWDQYWTPFLQEQVGMMLCGDWAIGAVRGGAPDLDLEIVPLPKGKQQATIVGGYNLATSASSQAPDAAWQLIEFLTDPAQDEMLQSYNRMPARLDATQSDVYADGDRAAFAAQAEFARARPVLEEWAQLENDIVATAWDATILGQSSPADAIRNAAEQVDAALA